MKKFSPVSLGKTFTMTNSEGFHSFRLSRELEDNMKEISNFLDLMNIHHGTTEAKLYGSVHELRADKIDLKELRDLIDYKQFKRLLGWHYAKSDNFYFFVKSNNQHTFFIQVSI